MPARPLARAGLHLAQRGIFHPRSASVKGRDPRRRSLGKEDTFRNLRRSVPPRPGGHGRPEPAGGKGVRQHVLVKRNPTGGRRKKKQGKNLVTGWPDWTGVNTQGAFKSRSPPTRIGKEIKFPEHKRRHLGQKKDPENNGRGGQSRPGYLPQEGTAKGPGKRRFWKYVRCRR